MPPPLLAPMVACYYVSDAATRVHSECMFMCLTRALVAPTNNYCRSISTRSLAKYPTVALLVLCERHASENVI